MAPTGRTTRPFHPAVPNVEFYTGGGAPPPVPPAAAEPLAGLRYPSPAAMPIKPEFRHFYGPAWRKEQRPAALERAAHRCEHCGKPDRTDVETITGKQPQREYHWMFWRTPCLRPGNSWIDHKGGLSIRKMNRYLPVKSRTVRVILTVAHLNHTPGDDRPENLRALCQWCHLVYDRDHHARTRAERKDASRPLLAAVL